MNKGISVVFLSLQVVFSVNGAKADYLYNTYPASAPNYLKQQQTAVRPGINNWALVRSYSYLPPTATGSRSHLPMTSTASVDISVAEIPPKRNPSGTHDLPESDEPTGVRGQDE